MLTKGDEYPIHQTPEPIAYSGSDRNFYDRYFFNGYNADGSIFFAASFGVYPHLNIMDGAVSILRDGVQRSVHVSRVLCMERMDTKVGPLSVEVLDPLKQIHLKLEEAEGLALDVVFKGRHFPIEEPRFTYRQGPRMLIDCTRMTQNGRWVGSMSVDGEEIEIADFYGTRDRSWGVRPIGARDPQEILPARLPQYYWLWAPINFHNLSMFFHVNEDAQGSPWNTRAMLAMDGAESEHLMHLNRPQMKVDWRKGSRRAALATLDLTDAEGRSHQVTYEPISTFMMKGIGYGHPTWGHGAYKGGYAIEREDFTPDNLPWQQIDNLHIQAIVKATHVGPDGQGSEGIGILEQLCLGPHGPNGWKDIVDA